MLEATECGLAVLTTRVGGIDDFFVGDLMLLLEDDIKRALAARKSRVAI